MDSLPGAVSLSRALMTLSRGRCSGALRVHAGRRSASVALLDGVPRAVSIANCGEELLGDVLLRAGDLDPVAHVQALGESTPRGPVGGWLVERGLVSRPAMELALRRQLRSRLLSVFLWDGLEYRFDAGAIGIGVPFVAEPAPAADVVLGALRQRVAELPASSRIHVRSARGFELTPLGLRLLEQAALWPEEAALAACLRRTGGAGLLDGLTSEHARAAALLQALVLVGGVRHAQSSYGLLVRKRGQMRRAESARALLDMPEQASAEQSRRALRRLVQHLHPDRLGPQAASVSTEVVRALLEADREIRSESSPR